MGTVMNKLFIGYFVTRGGRSIGARPVDEDFVAAVADMPRGAVRPTDCIWLVPTWVPPTPEPETTRNISAWSGSFEPFEAEPWETDDQLHDERNAMAT
jgi:hypothetical protein